MWVNPSVHIDSVEKGFIFIKKRGLYLFLSFSKALH